MMKLYFMQREFSGCSYAISDMLEEEKFQNLMCETTDSWDFLYFKFFGNGISSETSATVQTHLYHLVSVLYRNFEELCGEDQLREEDFTAMITELVEVCEYSTAFPVCLWVYGREAEQSLLSEWLAPLPTPEQMAHVLKLPHMELHEAERRPYRRSEPKAALKSYRSALAEFNRRRKLAVKNRQRDQTGA